MAAPPDPGKLPPIARWGWILALVALGAAAFSYGTWRSARHDRAALVARAGQLGLDRAALDTLAKNLARQSDPGEQRLVLARALLDRELTARSELLVAGRRSPPRSGTRVGPRSAGRASRELGSGPGGRRRHRRAAPAAARSPALLRLPGLGGTARRRRATGRPAHPCRAVSSPPPTSRSGER